MPLNFPTSAATPATHGGLFVGNSPNSWASTGNSVSNVVKQVIYITCSCQGFVFPILQCPHDERLIFRTCQLHTAWELRHENGGNEQQAAWHGQLHWLSFTKPRLFQRNRLRCSGNPSFESCVDGKAQQREIAVYSQSSFQRPQN